MSDWTSPIVEQLAWLYKGLGNSRFWTAELQTLFEQLVLLDKVKKEAVRIGYAYIDANFSDAQKEKFFSRVETRWHEIKKMETPLIQIQSQPEGSIHKLECVISVQLDKDTYSSEALFPIFRDYLIHHIPQPFDFLVVKVAQVQGRWYDLQVRYSCKLPDAFKLLLHIPWVQDAAVKPLSDFGRMTLAMIK
jgi:hypothetical protein